MKKVRILLNRLKDLLSVGENYYQGDLYKKFQIIFELIETKKITHKQAIHKVKNIFINDKKIKYELLKFIKNNYYKRIVLGNKLNLFSRINISIKPMKKNQYEPMHFHRDVMSFQIILKGKCKTNEFQKIKINKNEIQYKKFHSKLLNANELFLTGPNYKDIHGFGSKTDTCYILDVAKYYGLFGKTNGILGKNKSDLKNTRFYLDINKEKKINKYKFKSPLINEQEAYFKYSQF